MQKRENFQLRCSALYIVSEVLTNIFMDERELYLDN